MRASTRNDLRAPSGFSFKLQHPHLQPIPRTQPTTHERINFRAQCLTLRLGRLASKTNNHYIPRGVLTKAARRRFGPDLWCVSPLFCSSVIRSLAHSASLNASSLILRTVPERWSYRLVCVTLPRLRFARSLDRSNSRIVSPPAHSRWRPEAPGVGEGTFIPFLVILSVGGFHLLVLIADFACVFGTHHTANPTSPPSLSLRRRLTFTRMSRLRDEDFRAGVTSGRIGL